MSLSLSLSDMNTMIFVLVSVFFLSQRRTLRATLVQLMKRNNWCRWQFSALFWSMVVLLTSCNESFPWFVISKYSTFNWQNFTQSFRLMSLNKRGYIYRMLPTKDRAKKRLLLATFASFAKLILDPAIPLLKSPLCTID